MALTVKVEKQSFSNSRLAHGELMHHHIIIKSGCRMFKYSEDMAHGELMHHHIIIKSGCRMFKYSEDTV